MNIVKGNKKPGRTVFVTEKETGKLTQFTIHAGQQMWQLNLKTGLVTLAKTEDHIVDDVNMGKKIIEIADGFHVYLPALNRQNAINKFNRILTAAKK